MIKLKAQRRRRCKTQRWCNIDDEIEATKKDYGFGVELLPRCLTIGGFIDEIIIGSCNIIKKAIPVERKEKKERNREMVCNCSVLW